MNDAFYTNRLFFSYYLKEEEGETVFDQKHPMLPCYGSIEEMCKDRGINFEDYVKWKNWGELKMEMYYGSKKKSRS